MGTMDYFVKFYNSLDTVDLILLWVGIVVLIIIVFFSVYLYIKNKQLVSVIKEQKEELNNSKTNTIDNVIKDTNVNEKKIESSQTVNIEKKEVNNSEKSKNVIYSKNVLKNNDRRYQTSPINIVNNKNTMEELNDKKKDNISFTEELSKKIAEEIKPQTIELTDFEKKQEEEAIISYQELLTSSKDKVYNISDDEETTDFIQELKSFRNSL